jgi:hypothetical protein
MIDRQKVHNTVIFPSFEPFLALIAIGWRFAIWQTIAYPVHEKFPMLSISSPLLLSQDKGRFFKNPFASPT